MSAPFKKHSHQMMDAWGLAMARLIAEKIRVNPNLMEVPRRNLERWKQKYGKLEAAHSEWENILNQNSTEQILEILTQDNDEGQRLRQSDPFAGILNDDERMRLFYEYDAMAA